MRFFIPIFIVAISLAATGQEEKPTPTEELRVSVREWVETMRKIQVEENDWTRDQEVFRNYKEGLEHEIADLKEQIALAKIRKEGADQATIEKTTARDKLSAAKLELVGRLHGIEEFVLQKSHYFPDPLLKDAKMVQCVEDLQRALKLPEDKRGDDVSKRLMNISNIVSEAEKYQQTVHVEDELRTDGSGAEFKVQTIYFGLAFAYSVNEQGTFALAGSPTDKGWVFKEQKDIGPDIKKLIETSAGKQDPAFVNLPFIKP